MLELTWVEKLREIGFAALATNGAILLAFVAAYFIEVRPLVRAKEAGDALATACAERADTSMGRFVRLYLGLQVLLTAVYILFLQDRRIENGYAMFVFFPSILIAYSCFLFYRRDYYSRLRQAVAETGTPVLLDLNHRILDRIFVWQLEALSAIGIFVCGLLYFDGDFSVVVASAILLMWYVSIRTRKYLVREGLSYWYKTLLFGNIAAQTLKLVEIAGEYRSASAPISGSAPVFMIAITASLTMLQLGLCLSRLPGVWRGIRSAAEPDSTGCAL